MKAARSGRAVRLGALALTGAALATLSACTAARPLAAGSRTHPVVTSQLPASTPPSTAAAPSATRPRHRHHRSRPPRPTAATTSVAPSTVASSTAAPPPAQSTAPTSSPSTCDSVDVRVIRGGAAQGTEIAALQFTNSGDSPCALGDYPQVTLLRDLQPIGTPSEPQSGSSPRTVELAPGETAQSLLRDYSTCQAPLSDNARVTVPGETQHALRPAQMRACSLRVTPLSKQ